MKESNNQKAITAFKCKKCGEELLNLSPDSVFGPEYEDTDKVCQKCYNEKPEVKRIDISKESEDSASDPEGESHCNCALVACAA